MWVPCPSMLASMRTTGTVFLRQFCPQPCHALARGQAVFAFGENTTASALRLHSPFVKLFHALVLLQQLVMVLVDVFHHDVELFARQSRHGPVDEVEVIAAVKVVENIHNRQPMTFNLGTAANIDDP